MSDDDEMRALMNKLDAILKDMNINEKISKEHLESTITPEIERKINEALENLTPQHIESGKSSDLITLGMLHFQRGKYTDAREFFRKAHDKDKNNSIALYNIGMCSIMLFDYESAENSFREYLKKNNDDADAMYWLAFSVGSRGNLTECMEILERALSMDPDVGKRSGKIDIKGEKVESTLEQFRKAIKGK